MSALSGFRNFILGGSGPASSTPGQVDGADTMSYHPQQTTQLPQTKPQSNLASNLFGQDGSYDVSRMSEKEINALGKTMPLDQWVNLYWKWGKMQNRHKT